jgi:hypothetical protein
MRVARVIRTGKNEKSELARDLHDIDIGASLNSDRSCSTERISQKIQE